MTDRRIYVKRRPRGDYALRRADTGRLVLRTLHCSTPYLRMDF